MNTSNLSEKPEQSLKLTYKGDYGIKFKKLIKTPTKSTLYLITMMLKSF